MSPALSSYSNEIDYLYHKSLILESPSEMHPVLYFYFMDTLGHLDYTLCALAHSTDSIKCTMTGEYLRAKVDIAKTGDYALFPKFMVWLRDNHREAFENTPILWQLVYDPEEESKYIGFRFVLDPDSKTPLPPNFFHDMADDLFQTPFLRSIYPEGALGKLFEEFKKQQ
ncbi:MAG TPA: hypothetical protein O0X39_05925 [Methanocorpusculum sp.]|nr:hypothetical protein [Methanocorpusculum sp.]